MALQKINLTATESNWRLFMRERPILPFSLFKKKYLVEINIPAAFCGFQSKLFLESINLDGNYLNNRIANLVTSCYFCAQCFFLDAIGKSDFGGGILIHLPEMEQGELNAFCHVLFAVIITNNSFSSEAKIFIGV